MTKTLAFCLFKYFPHGGLQRDMLRIALACQRRGYKIAVYTTAWEGEVPDGLELHVHRPGGWTNHSRMRRYHAWLTRQIAEQSPACVVGFNKLPGLDVYFAADSCFAERARQRHRLFCLSARYRVYAAFEASVFAPEAATEILLIAEPQRQAFQQFYGTPAERLHLLPPWIAPERRRPENAAQVRQTIRQALGIAPADILLLQVGSGFKTKGLDRTLAALASLPASWRARTKLIVAGRDRSRSYPRMADRLGVAANVTFIGARDDIMELMAGADLLVHPARVEAAGVVLIEALASGLPVLCSGICGHAGHIRRAEAGVVLSEPFGQVDLNRHLLEMLSGDHLPSCAVRAVAYVQTLDVYAMPDRATDIIEAVVRRKAAQT